MNIFAFEVRERNPLFALVVLYYYWVSSVINKGGFFETAFVSTYICLALTRLLTFCLTLTR